MGVVKRQSIKNSLVNYIGVIIGAISSIFIYTLINSTELGMIQFAIGTATFFAPFASFASSMTATKFYSFFKTDDGKDNSFVLIVSLFTFFSSIIFILVIYIFRYNLSSFFEKDAEHFLNSLHFILIFTVLIAISTLFISLASNQNRIVVPSIFQNLLPKLMQPLLILLYVYNFITFPEIFKGLTFTFIIMTICLITYVYSLRTQSFNINFSERGKPLLRKYGLDMLKFSIFNFLIVIGSVFTQQTDKLLITPLLGYESLAIFSFGSMIAEAIDVPRKALSGITQPLIAISINESNWQHIKELYQKTALLQIILGVFLLTGVWACVDLLFDLMLKNGEIYRTGKNVILILGISRLADMATGVNAEIITYSQYYRFNFRSLMTMALLNIALNLLFIPTMGIEGSALATLLSITIVNIWRLLFIKDKFKIQPLDIRMVWVIGFGVIAWLLAYFAPIVSYYHASKISNALLNILIKGSIVTFVYVFLILYFNISEDLNNMFNKFYYRSLNFLKKLER